MTKSAVILALTLPLFGADTERVNFAPGGTIRIDRSYGDLHVEGWDRPEVEVTAAGLRVATERRSDTELTITTPRKTSGVRVEYEIHVPRESNLVIHHGTGFVSVNGVAGDIEASAGRGDIVLWLPLGAYLIDAKSKAGRVSSEVEGTVHNRYLIGQRFTSVNPSPSHRLRLRMGFGGITIIRIRHDYFGLSRLRISNLRLPL